MVSRHPVPNDVHFQSYPGVMSSPTVTDLVSGSLRLRRSPVSLSGAGPPRVASLTADDRSPGHATDRSEDTTPTIRSTTHSRQTETDPRRLSNALKITLHFSSDTNPESLYCGRSLR